MSPGPRVSRIARKLRRASLTSVPPPAVLFLLLLAGGGCASWKDVRSPLSAQLEEGKSYARARGTTIDGRRFVWQDVHRSGERLVGRSPMEHAPPASQDSTVPSPYEPLNKDDLTGPDSLLLSEIRTLEVTGKSRDRSAADLAIVVVFLVSTIFLVTLNN